MSNSSKVITVLAVWGISASLPLLPQSDPQLQTDPVTHQIQPIFTTSNMINGHLWRQMSGEMKSGYLMGLNEGLLLGGALDDPNGFKWPNLTFGEIAARLDGFYSDQLNLEIPVEGACNFLTIVGTPDKLKAALENTRKIWKKK